MKSTQRVRSERTPVKPRPEPAALDLAGLREQVSLVREALDDLVIVATDATAPSGQRICTRASNRRIASSCGTPSPRNLAYSARSASASLVESARRYARSANPSTAAT